MIHLLAGAGAEQVTRRHRKRFGGSVLWVRSRLLVLLVVLVVGGGCKAPARGPTGPPVDPNPLVTDPTTAPGQPTTTAASSFAVPAVIDLAYVQRVLETIYHLDGEATRHVYATKVPDTELNDRLEAIFGRDVLVNAKRLLGESAADGFASFADPPGDATIRAVEVIQATATCVSARADLDYNPQYRKPGRPQPQAVILMSRAEILPYNPTGWAVVGAGVPIDPNASLKVCR